MAKIIINTDIGGDFDDVLALVLALNSPEIEIAGVVTTKQHIRDKALFARKLLDSADRHDIPVFYAGQVLDDDRYVNVFDYKFLTSEERTAPDNENRISSAGIDFIIETVKKNPGEITLASLAPNTNIAAALQQDPSLAGKIKAVYAMGGVLDQEGGQREYPEHNYRIDRAAFYALCEQTSFPVYFLPRNLTRDLFLPVEVLKERQHASRLAAQVWQLAQAFLERTGYDSFRLSDPLTLGAVVQPELYVASPHQFYRKETRRSGEVALARQVEQGNVFCFTDFDRKSVYDLLVSRL